LLVVTMLSPHAPDLGGHWQHERVVKPDEWGSNAESALS